MSLTHGLHRAMQQRPNAVATICAGRRRSFAELGDRVARLAGALRALGMRDDDRIGILSLNSDRYLESYLGVYWGGGAVNPINIRWSAAEIAYSLDDCDTTVLIVDDKFKHAAADLQARSKGLRTIIYADDGATPEGMLSYEALIAQHAPIADAQRRGNDLAGVFYTGGTTGFPKGVMLSHGGMVSNALAGVAEGIAAEGFIALHAAPMFHLADVFFTNAGLLRGGTHVFIPGFDTLLALQTIQDEKVTEIGMVPLMIQLLVDHPQARDHDLSSVQQVLYGGAPISEAVLDRALKAMPPARFYQAYGMTELSPAATILPPYDHTPEGRERGKIRSGGRATFGVDVRIVNADGNEVPRGQVGEIAARGPNVMLGYWNKPSETAAALRGGWMHTGDGGRMDEDGFVFVVDRIKDMIVTGGENVYSIEVENALAHHPAIAACAVIGVPDEQWGERVHAIVVLKPGASASGDELIAHCKERIANYKCPRGVEFRDALPVSGAGKLLKAQLRAPFWEGRDRGVA